MPLRRARFEYGGSDFGSTYVSKSRRSRSWGQIAILEFASLTVVSRCDLETRMTLDEFRGRIGRMYVDGAWRSILRNDVCAYCGEHAPYQGVRRRITIEHVTPLSEGGTNRDDNLATACSDCNSARSSHPLLLFLAWRATGLDGHVKYHVWIASCGREVSPVRPRKPPRSREYKPEVAAPPLLVSIGERIGMRREDLAITVGV